MTLAPVYFTVAGRYRSVVADATTDSNTDPEIGAVSATVTFQPLISSGDVILASQAAPRPTGFLAAPIVALIDPTDGLLKLRTTQDAGASGGLGYVPVRLLADTAVLELNGPLYYTVTFSDVVYNNGARGAINSFTFQAPTSDLELDLITVSTGPSQVAAGLTKVAPTGVRYDPTGSGSIIFTVAGVDIPDPVPVAALRGPTGASGASGGTGGTGGVGATGAQGASGIPGATGIPGVSGVPGLVGATGPVGATGASGASGGTGGTGLAGQSVSLKGSVATYAGLPGSATNGDGYILLTDNLLYVYNSGWPAEGSGVPFVGPAGSTGASGVPGASGIPGASGVPGSDGASGTPGLDGASGIPGATGPTGATGASGGTGGTGGTGASGAGIVQSISTITADTTLGSAANTNYVTFVALTAPTAATYAAATGMNNWTYSGSTSQTRNYTHTTTTANYALVFVHALVFVNDGTPSATVTFDGVPMTLIQARFAAGNESSGFLFGLSGSFSGSYTVSVTLSGYNQGFRATSIAATYNDVASVGTPVSGSTSVTINSASNVVAFSGSRDGTSGIALTGSTSRLSQQDASGLNDIYSQMIDVLSTNPTTRSITSSRPGLVGVALNLQRPSIPTLPSASGNTNRYSLRNVSGLSITIGTTSSQQINGATGGLALANNTSVELISDSTAWYSF